MSTHLSPAQALLLAARKELDARSLWFILADGMGSVERIRRGFEKVADRAPGQATRVREAFKHHRQLLDQACRQVRAQPAVLKKLAEELSQATGELDQALLAHREAAQMAMGPTRLGGANSILNARSTRALAVCLASERERLEHALEASELSDSVRHVLSRMLELVGVMLLELEAPSLPELLRQYRSLAEEAQEVFALAEAQAASGRGPTPHAGLNRLLHAARQGQPVDCQEVLGDVAGLRNQLSSLARMQSGSAQVEAISQRLEQRFDELEAALEWLEQGAAEVEQVAHALQAAFAGLAQEGQHLAELADSEGKTPCVHCGQLNRSDFSACSRCGAVLPRVAAGRASYVDLAEGDSTSQGVPMTENLKRLMDAVGAFESGSLQKSEFLGQLAWFRGLLERALALWPPGQRPPPDYLEALQDLEAGLSFLEQAEGPGVELDSGRALVLKGAGQALQAGR